MDDVLQRVREGPIKLVLEMYGFRRDRNRWACHVHDDKRPSCTISGNRLRCWVCDKTWSNLDLVMDRDGVGVVEASKRLAELYGMPSSTMSDVERKAYAAEREARAAEARKAEWFRRGMRILVDRRLRDAGPVAAVHVWRWHRRAHVVRSGTDEDVLKCWPMTPAERLKVEVLGRTSIAEAEKLTERIVRLLGSLQEKEMVK